LAKEIALAAGGLFADSRLGPQGPDASKIARTTASTLKAPLSKVAKWSKSMDNVAGVASKMNAVYDVLDFDELDTADAAIKNVEKAIENEKAAHKRIVENIWAKWRMRVMTFLASLERANKQLEASAAHLEEVRDALREQRDIARYNPPVAWRIAA
jgi:DNA repair ATPase RecN